MGEHGEAKPRSAVQTMWIVGAVWGGGPWSGVNSRACGPGESSRLLLLLLFSRCLAVNCCRLFFFPTLWESRGGLKPQRRQDGWLVRFGWRRTSRRQRIMLGCPRFSERVLLSSTVQNLSLTLAGCRAAI